MKIKLDENLPASLTTISANLHHDVHTVAEENLSGGSDRDVWEAAQRDARFRQSLIRRVREVFQREEVIRWAKCFVVATERKVRVVRPPD